MIGISINITSLTTQSIGASDEALTVVSVEAQNDLITDYGTTFGDIPFVTTVNATLSDMSVVEVTTTYAQGGYDGTGSQIFIGTLSNLPVGVTNPSNVTSEVNVYLQRTFRVSFGTASSTTSLTGNWNYMHSNSTSSDVTVSNLIDVDGDALTGLNITQTDAIVSANTGPAGAFDDSAGTTYPAGALSGFWYPPFEQTRSFFLTIPAGVYRDSARAIKIVGATNSADPPRGLDITINSVQKTLADIEDNTTQLVQWSTSELASTEGNATLTVLQTNDGIKNISSTVNVFEITFTLDII